MLKNARQAFQKIRFFGHRYTVLNLVTYVLATLWVAGIGLWAMFTDQDVLRTLFLIAILLVNATLVAHFSATWARGLVHPVLRLIIKTILLTTGTWLLAIIAIYMAYGLYETHGLPDTVTMIMTLGVPVLIQKVPPLVYYFAHKYIFALRLYTQFSYYQGGQMDFASVANYRGKKVKYIRGSHLWTKAIILGSSTYEYDPKSKLIGDPTDANLITFGMIGSGKSTTTIWPNLLSYAGSAFILDPKAEHLATAYHRRQGKTGGFNGKCIVLDPFDYRADHTIPSSGYNPLSEIDPTNESGTLGLIKLIAESLVIDEQNTNTGRHFVDMPRKIVAGFIGHVLTTQPKENHHLPFVLDLLYGIDEFGIANHKKFKETLFDMRCNDALGGIIQQSAKDLMDMGDKERGSMLSTLSRSLDWIGDPVMREHLKQPSDFAFQDIGVDGYSTTVYVCIPLHKMGSYNRWLRVLTSLSFAIMRSRKARPKVPTLFLLDEFPQLGKFDIIHKAYATERATGIRLWVFCQNWSQLKGLYGEGAYDFLAGSTSQFFGVNDIETATIVSNNLGTRTTDGQTKPLMTPAEVMSLLDKEANRQIVFPASTGKAQRKKLPYLLERHTYKRYRNDFRAVAVRLPTSRRTTAY